LWKKKKKKKKKKSLSLTTLHNAVGWLVDSCCGLDVANDVNSETRTGRLCIGGTQSIASLHVTHQQQRNLVCDIIVVSFFFSRLYSSWGLKANSDGLYGDFAKGLNKKGERVALLDAVAREVDWVEYSDSYPWPGLADGLGSSLERLCSAAVDADGFYVRHAGNWIASPAPQHADVRVEIGGSPLKANTWSVCPPLPFSSASAASVHISEIHYHAVGENLMREQYEFVELWNRGLYDYDLSHHRLHGDTLRYRFPTGTKLAVGARLVVSPNPPALIAAYSQQSGGAPPANRVVGPYEGELGNGGGELVLIDDNGREIERVKWDDAFPWPHAADALGGADEWLADGSKFKGKAAQQWLRGQSLHRVDYSNHRAAAQPASWVAADASPARAAPDAVYRWPATPQWVAPIVAELDAKSLGRDAPVADSVTVVRARTEPWPSAAKIERVECRYYVDDLYDTSKHAALRKNAATAAAVATTNGAYECDVPAYAAGTVVRYQIWLYMEGGVTERSPRDSDPYQWHAFFVPPKVTTDADIYHLYINGSAWGGLIQNAHGGRVEADGCSLRESWNAEASVTVVYRGVVADARARHQGSRYNRDVGEDLSLADWTAKGYVGPAGLRADEPFQALSWRFKLPPWVKFGGRREVILNKMRGYCVFYTAPLHFGLADKMGLWGAGTRMVRLHVNGGYFRYMLEIERPGEDSMADWLKRVNQRCPTKPTLSVGHLFKAQGCACDEGPYGFGTMVPLPASCNYTSVQRYEYTYDRKSWNDARDATHDAFVRLLDGLNALAVAENGAECQAWFAKNFDVNLMLSYVAHASWAGVWDDNIHNWYATQRREDGKWFWSPWDADALYGEYSAQGKTFNATLYEGDGDDIFQKQIGHNALKTAFIRCHRAQLNQRFADLQDAVYSVDATDSILADAKQTFYDRDFKASFGTYVRSPTICSDVISKYLVERRGWVQAELSKKGVAGPKPLQVCPDVPDVARREYNRFYAPGTLALAAYYGKFGSVSLGWSLPNTWRYSGAAGARKRQPSANSTIVLLARGAELAYSVAPPSAGWQSAAFDHSAWPRAKAPLGYDARRPWAFGGNIAANTRGLWVRTVVQISAAQLGSMTGSTLFVVADNAADVYFNEKLVSGEASENRNHDAMYFNAQVQLGRLPWTVGANTIAAYVLNNGEPDDLVFDIEVTMSTAPPATTGAAYATTATYDTVATVTAPAPTPAGKPNKYDTALLYVLDRAALPGSPDTVDADALTWTSLYNGAETEYVDRVVDEGKWYAYRLAIGESEQVVQIVRTLTSAEAASQGQELPSGPDLTPLWWVLGIGGAIALLALLAVGLSRYFKRRERRENNIALAASRQEALQASKTPAERSPPTPAAAESGAKDWRLLAQDSHWGRRAHGGAGAPAAFRRRMRATCRRPRRCRAFCRRRRASTRRSLCTM
jgi:hypothetical protein